MSDRWLKGVIYNDRLSPKDIEIKELRKDIEKLNKGYCPIKEKCNKGECDCTNEEYNQMCEENIKLDLEIERLNKEIEYLKEGKPIFKSIGLEVYEENEKRINKAIEYIEKHIVATETENILLNILKGVDEE